jgi:pimeloyl-ACP methyl ester carboxylesterase
MECTVRGIPVFYEEAGVGRPLLMLHGWPSDHRLTSYFMEPILTERSGWRRIYPDLPGMGKTPGADWIVNQDDMLAVVLAFLDAVAPGERIVVVGASYGGFLARGVLHERMAQMDGLMLWAPSVTPGDGERHVPPPQTLVRDAEALATLEPDEALWTRAAVVQTAETLAAFRASVKPGLQAADVAFRQQLQSAGFVFSFAVDELAEPFPAPTLILTGRQDSMVGYRDAWGLLERYPRATFVTLDRAGHALAEEQPTLFRVLVHEWLDRVEEYAMSNELKDGALDG